MAVSPWWIARRPEGGALRRDWRPLAVAIVAGGAVGPALLTAGLVDTPAATASLLLNMELVATVVLAATLFREHLGAQHDRSRAARHGGRGAAGVGAGRVGQPRCAVDRRSVRLLGTRQQRHVADRPGQPATCHVPERDRGGQRQPRPRAGHHRAGTRERLVGRRCVDRRRARLRGVDHAVGARRTTTRRGTRSGDLRLCPVPRRSAVVGRAVGLDRRSPGDRDGDRRARRRLVASIRPPPRSITITPRSTRTNTPTTTATTTTPTPRAPPVATVTYTSTAN